MSEAQANRRTSAARRRQQREDAAAGTTKKSTPTVDNSTIQDRIRKWQTQDAAEAVDPDVLSVRSMPRSERSRTPMRSRSPAHLPDEPQSTPRKRSTKWVQQESTWIKQRRSMREQKRSPASARGTAKERVVEPPIREETPPVEYPRNDSLRTRNVNSSRAERELRRKRRREVRAKADNGNALVEDGIRVYARSESHPASERFERDTAPARSEILDDQRSEQEAIYEAEVQYAKSAEQTSPQDTANEYSYRDHEDELPGQEPRQPSRYAQTLGRAPEPVEAIEQPKTRKRIILNKTKEILTGRNDVQPPVSNRIPSIEAWLEEQPDMPDPFVDNKEGSVAQPTNLQKTPKHRSHRKKIPSEPTILEVDDPNRIWDSVAQAQQREPRRPSRREPKNVSQQSSEMSTPSRRLFSFEVCDEPSKGEECVPQPPTDEAVEHQSPVTLKRRDARTIRQARRPQPEPSPPTKTPEERPSSQNKPQSVSRNAEHGSPVKKPLPQIPIEPVAEAAVATEEDAVLLDRAPSRGLKRKLTTHEDLLSVLSLPRARRSTRSNLSLRNAQAPSTENIVQEAMRVMQQEEIQYVRELRTLVDGVTPVLLQSLLSKSDAMATAVLFSDNQNNNVDFTRPIIQMGGALERLKSLHARIPLQDQNIESLLSWAVTAHRYYSDYLKSWRLGFSDIIVNLAPLDGDQMREEDMLSRDRDGDVTDEQGQKVDVAFLQKRPLIRIKKLSKLFATIRAVLPGHKRASTVADIYADLTEKAKQRHSEEQGRLEDEAAANTDTTRARDIKTMGITESVSIDRRRKVRARDYFDMTLQHSNGQRVDCKVEIILRDDPIPSGAGGDILICQVEEASKWLLFAPVHLSNVSVRRDQSPCDLVMMIRGVLGIGKGWHELLALRAEDQEAVTEWLHMLGSNPIPPPLKCIASWHQIPDQQDLPPEALISPTPTAPVVPLSRSALLNIPSDVDMPIGEPSVILTRRKRKDNNSSTKVEEPVVERTMPKLSLGGGLQRKDVPSHYQNTVSVPKSQPPISTRTSERSSPLNVPSKVATESRTSSHESKRLPSVDHKEKSAAQEPLVPRSRYPPQKFAHNSSNISGITSTSRNSYFTEPEAKPYADAQTPDETRRLLQEITNAEKSWANEPLMSGALGPASPIEVPIAKQPVREQPPVQNDSQHTQAFAHRLRRHSRSKSSSTPLSENIREQWSAMSGLKKHQSTPNTPEKNSTVHDLVTEDDITPPARPQPRPNSQSASRSHSRQESLPTSMAIPQTRPLPPPPQKSTYTISSSPHNSMVSLQDSLLPEKPRHTEPTSPLKNEYQPSSSASGTESDDDDTDATSDTSDDIGSEIKDQAMPLPANIYESRRTSRTMPNAQNNVASTGTRTLDPSDSASNGPYRQAPPPSAYPAEKKKRTIAMVCSWSDRGIWEPIRAEECSIVVSPGLVQAFPMSAAHSQPMSGAEWEESVDTPASQESPLVEFELTPVVPLRKGTALDITIRSPPTANSTVTTTNNVMFRSRTVQECERLYQYINWARCHNPVFAQLARDRPRQEPVTFASNVQENKSRSWFSFGSREKTSYRAQSRPPASMADTAASGSSATSAFSALRRFGKNSPFSLKRSSVVRRSGMDNSGGSLYSSSNGTGPSSASSTPAPSQAGFVPGREGPNVPQTSAEAANGGGMVNNMKIRLFVRQGQKWEALGQSLLTVLPAGIPQKASQPNSPGASTPASDALPPQRISRAPGSVPQPRTTQFRLPSSGTTPHRIHGDGREKRVLITNAKRKEIVLLDEVLGESCFEKVMQTGIAVNVWKEDEAVQNWGGVMTGRSKMYMIQFRTSTEASWVFNMCGTYRYGNAAPS